MELQLAGKTCLRIVFKNDVQYVRTLSKAYAVFKSFSRTGVSAYDSTMKLRTSTFLSTNHITFDLSYVRRAIPQKDKCPRAVEIRWERSKDAVLYKTVSLKRTPCSKYTEKRGIFKAVGGLGTDTRDPLLMQNSLLSGPHLSATYSILNL